MAKDPAFLFYPNDWIGGTMGMTFEQKGAYMELLMLQFNRGHMTSHMIGQVLGKTYGQIWVTIKDKFEVDTDGKYFNRRLEEEQKNRKAFTESRRNNLRGKNQYSNQSHKSGHTNGHTTSRMENEDEDEDILNLNKTIKANSTNKEEIDQSVKKQTDFPDQIIDVFADEYKKAYKLTYNKIAVGQERKMAGKLITLYKKKFPKAKTDEAADGLRIYFRKCMMIEDPWFQDNMSLSTIVSKFNIINKILKNGTVKGHNAKGVTDRELAEITAKHFATDYEK